MGLNVALIDKSEITQKMISHSLHYYPAKIHRFENMEDLLSQSSQIKPDVIFIDWDLKKGNESMALAVQKKIQDLPIIVLYRNASDPHLEKAKNRIKKPIDANALRKMVVHIVPKANQFKLNPFLDFPATKKVSEPKEEKSPLLSKQVSSPNKSTTSPSKSEKTFNLPNIDTKENVIEKDRTIEESEFTVARTSNKEESYELPELDGDNMNTTIQKPKEFIGPEEDETSVKTEFSAEEATTQMRQGIQDLLVQKGSDLLLQVLKEYQKTEEFKQSLDKIVQSALDQNMEAFMKQFLEKEIENVKKQLPAMSKELIQKEIDKLLSQD